MNRNIHIIIILLIFHLTHAQVQKYHSFTINNGLSDAYIKCFAQDEYGYIWIGTESGLNCFDGYDFRHFLFENNENSIADNYISSLAAPGNGKLYIGTNDGFSIYTMKNQTFANFYTDSTNNNSLPDNHILCMEQGINSNLWIGTNAGGLCAFNTKTEIFTAFPHDSVGAVTTLHYDGKNFLWTGTYKNGVYIFNIREKEFKRFRIPFKTGKINDIYIDKYQNVWIGTALNGLIHYNPENDTFQLFFKSYPDYLLAKRNRINKILEDKNGTLWIDRKSVV